MRRTQVGLMRSLFALNLGCLFVWFVVGPWSGSEARAQQESATVFHGAWTATVGAGQVLRGTWAGQTSPRGPNLVQGSWTLFNEASEIALEGTWSAQKTGRGWQGTWRARTMHGGSFSGTWDADLAEFSGKTLEEMLKRTTGKQVAGSWRSGRYQGNWWLDGSVSKGGRR